MMKKIFKTIIILITIVIIITVAINLHICLSVKNQIITDFNKEDNYDAVLVLGAGIRKKKPSPLLRERLDRGIEIYKSGAAKKLIMSGDHGTKEHDEVNVMKNYAIENGVPSEDIFMDHAGFSTYESVYRAKEIFKAQNIVIVTQEYHLYRALYIANSLKLQAVGSDASVERLGGQTYRDFREILARNKDFITCIFKPEPTYLGEEIPITGNGDVTNDK
jgi:vancomycin permeability regulator SanA